MINDPFGPGGTDPRARFLAGIASALFILRLQHVRVNAGFAIGNNNRTDRLLVKTHRTRRADDRVNVSHLSQRPEGGEQQRVSDSSASRGLQHAGWTKESAARA